MYVYTKLTKSCKQNAWILYSLPFDINTSSYDYPQDKSGIINKTGNFFKDNCVAITSLAFLPQLIDEANASIQGHKIAQKVLPKDTLKHLARTNTMAFLTYAISAIGMVLATFVADKVRNATC